MAELVAGSGLVRPVARPGRSVGFHAGALMLVVTSVSAVAGFAATGHAASSQAVSAAGPELVHLLRAMALLKTLFAAVAIGATVWRVAAPVGLVRLAAYGLACAATAAGPGLIWDMAHVRLGALLLHGGLLATVLLLWRDPATAMRLRQAVTARRSKSSL